MSITLFAQPYDISATGFYFDDLEGYESKIRSVRNDYGQKVEEFEIQFIDGEAIDSALAKAVGLSQANVDEFLALVDDLDEYEKQVIVIAVGECGYGFDPDPQAYDVDIYPVGSMRELAEQFVDEGLFGDIPERLQHYIDYDAIGYDLSMDYAEIEVAGERLIYRCG